MKKEQKLTRLYLATTEKLMQFVEVRYIKYKAVWLVNCFAHYYILHTCNLALTAEDQSYFVNFIHHN